MEFDTTQRNILLIEDNKGDARLLEIMLEEVREQIFHIVWKDRLSLGLTRLKDGDIHVVLLDLDLPDSQGFDTFDKIHEIAPYVPIIVMTGLNDQKIAVDAVRKGAQDYLLKGQVTGDLVARAINYAIERKRLELEREKLIDQLRDALAKIKTLRGLIPICSFCKKIRDDSGFWKQIEIYVRDHSDAEFSHSICPDCAKKHYPSLYNEKINKKDETDPSVDKKGE
ncbi:MAG: response regulator [Spirochaetales bacterium]|nr:response regulator [Spirochaetales bacterium]